MRPGTADGGPIVLNGVTYAKGLGVHAMSEVVYAIPSGCSQFFAAVGVDDEVGANGRVQFQVWADSSLLFQSAALTGNSATVSVAVTLAGQSQLRLVVTDGGDGVTSDHADWGAARFLCGAVNNPPTPTITSPAAGTLFRVGDVISFSGSATDTENGTLPPASLEWTVTLYHCPGIDCHVHPFLHDRRAQAAASPHRTMATTATSRSHCGQPTAVVRPGRRRESSTLRRRK